MKTPVLTVKNIAVSYRRRAGIMKTEKFWALKDVSFTLNYGETLGIIGRNGVGKSTLLKAIAGIIVPDSGEIIREHGLRISLLSLQAGFINHLSGRDNAIMGGILLGLSRRQIEERLEGIHQFSELNEFFDQPVNTYSSGMRARLGFSVAIHADPDVLLIDEILGVGDAVFRKKSSQAMRQIIRSDKTIVYVSHGAQNIRKLCDRAVWVESGVTQAEGDVDEVLGEYQKFVKRAV
jgi:lipopolysaccharide transport system ATP-binding protein